MTPMCSVYVTLGVEVRIYTYKSEPLVLMLSELDRPAIVSTAGIRPWLKLCAIGIHTVGGCLRLDWRVRRD